MFLFLTKLFSFIIWQRCPEKTVCKYITQSKNRSKAQSFPCLNYGHDNHTEYPLPAKLSFLFFLPFPLNDLTHKKITWLIWTEFLSFHLYFFHPEISQNRFYIFQSSSKHVKLLPGDLLLTRFQLNSWGCLFQLQSKQSWAAQGELLRHTIHLWQL